MSQNNLGESRFHLQINLNHGTQLRIFINIRIKIT